MSSHTLPELPPQDTSSWQLLSIYLQALISQNHHRLPIVWASTFFLEAFGKALDLGPGKTLVKCVASGLLPGVAIDPTGHALVVSSSSRLPLQPRAPSPLYPGMAPPPMPLPLCSPHHMHLPFAAAPPVLM
ncbi:unnamed protein product, partial [Phaeothamnion confervicola]